MDGAIVFFFFFFFFLVFGLFVGWFSSPIGARKTDLLPRLRCLLNSRPLRKRKLGSGLII